MLSHLQIIKQQECLRSDGTRPLDKGLEDALTDYDYDVTFHLFPLPLSLQSSYAPVRNREFQRDESNFKGTGKKGKGRNKGNSQGSNAAPRGVKGAVGSDNPGVMSCVLKSHLLLMRMRFAVRIRMKCPKGRTDLGSSSTVSLSMKAYSRNLCWYGRSYSLLLETWL